MDRLIESILFQFTGCGCANVSVTLLYALINTRIHIYPRIVCINRVDRRSCSFSVLIRLFYLSWVKWLFFCYCRDVPPSSSSLCRMHTARVFHLLTLRRKMAEYFHWMRCMANDLDLRSNMYYNFKRKESTSWRNGEKKTSKKKWILEYVCVCVCALPWPSSLLVLFILRHSHRICVELTNRIESNQY